MTPWSGNAAASPRAPIVLSAAPGGGACAKTLAERPFAPAFSARPKGTKAGAYSPLDLRITRSDGQQELKGVDVTLAPGMTGKLAGIPYCPDSALAAAAASAGSAEQANSSCPAKSLVGSATIAAGTGPAPLQIGGKVFLSGPYHGAPLSLAVITPATAGPFDLGTVVVRVALFVDPETAQIHAVSDPIPNVYGGTQLSVRAVDVNVDRKNFTLNPTSCGPLSRAGTLHGGGADPANPAAFSAFAVSTPFQTSDCGALGFRPKLFTRLFGGRKATKRNQHPKFRAVLVAREGDANICRAALTLPHSQFLDQSHIRTICTRVQLAAERLPEGGDLRLRAGEDAAARRRTGGAGLPDLLQQRTAGPARRPQGPGQRAAARRDQRRQGADQERLLPGARRAGEQVRADDERRQARPPGQLPRPLRPALVLVHELQSPERQAAAQEEAAAAGAPRCRKASGGKQQGKR